jgi:3-phosphoglycerate kinase
MEANVTLNPKENSIEKDQVTQELNQKIKSEVYCELKLLKSCCNLDATRIVNDIEQGRDIILDQVRYHGYRLILNYVKDIKLCKL